MNDFPKVRFATLVDQPNGLLLTLRTVEGIDVQFMLDDLAATTLYATTAGALEMGASRAPIVFRGVE